MGRTEFTLAVGFSEETGLGNLGPGFAELVVLTDQQIFNEHWLCVRFSAIYWGYSMDRAESLCSQSSPSGVRETDRWFTSSVVSAVMWEAQTRHLTQSAGWRRLSSIPQFRPEQ